MAEAPRIAIDAMGGDEGPALMLAGVAQAHLLHPHLRFDLVNAILDHIRFTGTVHYCSIVFIDSHSFCGTQHFDSGIFKSITSFF